MTACLSFGRELFDDSLCAKAEKVFWGALLEAEAQADTAMLADAHFWLAEAILHGPGHHLFCDFHYDTAIMLYGHTGEVAKEADAIMARVGRSSSRRTDDTLRVQLLQRARDNYEGLDDTLGMANALLRIGQEYQDGRPNGVVCDSARLHYGLAAEFFDSVGHTEGYYEALAGVVGMFNWKERACYWPDSARYFVNSLLRKCQLEGDTTREAALFGMRARTFENEGRTAEQLADLRQAANLHRASGNTTAWLGVAWGITSALSSIGNNDSALTVAEEMLQVISSRSYDDQESPWNYLSYFQSIVAQLVYKSGLRDSALSLMDAVITSVPDSTGDEYYRSGFRKNYFRMGFTNFLKSFGAYSDALRFYDQGIAAKLADSTLTTLEFDLLLASECAVKLEEWDWANTYLRLADSLAQENKEYFTEYIPLYRADYYMARDMQDSAVDICRTQMDTVRELYPALLSDFCLFCGDVYLQAGMIKAADSLFLQGLESFKSSSTIGGVERAMARIAHSYLKSSDSLTALSYFKRSQDSFNAIRWYAEAASLDSLITVLDSAMQDR